MEPRDWHPDELELELSRTGEADERVMLHVPHCPRCLRDRAGFAAMAAELGAAPPAILIPRARDQQIRAAIAAPVLPARQAPAGRRSRSVWMWVAPAVAAAAIAVLVLRSFAGDRADGDQVAPEPRIAGLPTVRGDVNGDGRIDVRDAFTMARTLDRGGAPAAWDVTGDGRVDRGDVDWIAMAAVSIGGPR